MFTHAQTAEALVFRLYR